MGGFLYYARALDYTILLALNKILSTQAKPTQYTKEEYQQIIDYRVMYLNVYIRYYTTDIVLLVDSNVAYLVMPNTKSRIARYF